MKAPRLLRSGELANEGAHYVNYWRLVQIFKQEKLFCYYLHKWASDESFILPEEVCQQLGQDDFDRKSPNRPEENFRLIILNTFTVEFLDDSRTEVEITIQSPFRE